MRWRISLRIGWVLRQIVEILVSPDSRRLRWDCGKPEALRITSGMEYSCFAGSGVRG